MKLLDLFCGAGGAAMGYYRAGFHEIIGIDINFQKNYPFDFIQSDALHPPIDLNDFDLIHASPPCQRFSQSRSFNKNWHNYPDFLSPCREMLIKSNVSYVIENVPGTPMRVDVMLCGTMFGLRTFRHRWFESSKRILFLISPCKHNGTVKDGDYFCVINGGTPNLEKGYHTPRCKTEDMKKAMGIDWMTRKEMTQAIPPAYTQFIGERIIQYL